MIDFEADAALRQIVEERATYLFADVPDADPRELLDHPGFRDARSLVACASVNQVAPPDMQRAVQAAFPQAAQVAAHRAAPRSAG